MKRKTDGSRRHGRIRFMLKRRQMLKMLGISATALSLPAAAQADLLDWFKGHDRPPAPAGKAPSLLNLPSGRLI